MRVVVKFCKSEVCHGSQQEWQVGGWEASLILPLLAPGAAPSFLVWWDRSCPPCSALLCPTFSYDLRWESSLTNDSWDSFGFITATHHNLLFLRTHTNRFGMRTVDSFGDVLSVCNHVGADHSPCALQD